MKAEGEERITDDSKFSDLNDGAIYLEGESTGISKNGKVEMRI